MYPSLSLPLDSKFHMTTATTIIFMEYPVCVRYFKSFTGVILVKFSFHESVFPVSRGVVSTFEM